MIASLTDRITKRRLKSLLTIPTSGPVMAQLGITKTFETMATGSQLLQLLGPVGVPYGADTAWWVAFAALFSLIYVLGDDIEETAEEATDG